MKIAILSPFYPFRGGLAQLNARLYSELGATNDVKAYTFTTLYPNFLFPGKTQFVAEGDTAQEINSIRLLSSVNPLSYIKTARQINKFAPDVLIIPYWMSFFSPAFGSVCRLINKRTKIVSLVHNAVSHEKMIFEKPLANFFLQQCDAYIVMSNLVKQDLLSLNEKAIILQLDHPIYDQYKNKINRDEACSLLGISPVRKNLLFFGFIRDYKGLDILIQATKYLDDSFQLIIAGECYGSFNKYSELIEASHLKNNIIVFDEYINDDKASLLFSATDVLVLPYKSATQSGVVAMAYQLETPMIATDVGALGLTLEQSKTGLVVPNATPEAIASGIKSYFEEDKTSLYLENIRKEKERLSWKNFTANLEVFLNQLLSRNSN